MSGQPSGFALMGAMSKINQLRQMLGADAEPQLILDVIEGETNVLELLDEVVETILSDERLADDGRERIKRFETRANKRRALVMQVLERIGIRKAERALYTVSVADGPKAVRIIDEEQIPLQFQRISPDKVAIGKVLKEGGEVAGAQLNNGPPVLRIMR